MDKYKINIIYDNSASNLNDIMVKILEKNIKDNLQAKYRLTKSDKK